MSETAPIHTAVLPDDPEYQDDTQDTEETHSDSNSDDSGCGSDSETAPNPEDVPFPPFPPMFPPMFHHMRRGRPRRISPDLYLESIERALGSDVMELRQSLFAQEYKRILEDPSLESFDKIARIKTLELHAITPSDFFGRPKHCMKHGDQLGDRRGRSKPCPGHRSKHHHRRHADPEPQRDDDEDRQSTSTDQEVSARRFGGRRHGGGRRNRRFGRRGGHHRFHGPPGRPEFFHAPPYPGPAPGFWPPHQDMFP